MGIHTHTTRDMDGAHQDLWQMVSALGLSPVELAEAGAMILALTDAAQQRGYQQSAGYGSVLRTAEAQRLELAGSLQRAADALADAARCVVAGPSGSVCTQCRVTAPAS